ncbi:M23 family metallopeptidase [Altererythrobacter sp. ZODW24]|uniref:M23 family metallopeptidase n=1 Tax=Altererythrobacter sp. ZODW24 TaxID=2185142 RepID=UPI000DF7F7E7|nr:M23 family metallopeptidase [Altererythrobacter sp. ZODW24]
MKRLALTIAAFVLLGAGDPATETEHVVGEGETLGGIANRAGVPLASIAAVNGLTEPYSVRVGQKLFIPRQRTHTVKSGDTAMGVANRYKVPYSQLAIANGLNENGSIRIGQKLIIPAVMSQAQVASMTNAMTNAKAPEVPYFRRPHDGPVMLGYNLRANGKGHDGLDFKAELGDMVRAASTGTVIFAGSEPTRFGRLVVIDHGRGWHTAYGHLSSITVKEGETIRAGERLGLAGEAGIATTPELHFEIRKDGKPINPAPKMPKRTGN